MIFRVDLAESVMAGRKTVTRRLAKGPCRYRVGKDVAVQPGRGKPAVGRIFITGITLEELGRITPGEARREGFESVADFKHTWKELHGHYDDGEMIYRIAFEAVPNGG